jgi:hypothetical protein
MLAAAIAAVPSIVFAAEPAPAPEPSPLQFEWSARLRHAAVDDDSFARGADATTLPLCAR